MTWNYTYVPLLVVFWTWTYFIVFYQRCTSEEIWWEVAATAFVRGFVGVDERGDLFSMMLKLLRSVWKAGIQDAHGTQALLEVKLLQEIAGAAWSESGWQKGVTRNHSPCPRVSTDRWRRHQAFPKLWSIPAAHHGVAMTGLCKCPFASICRYNMLYFGIHPNLSSIPQSRLQL